MLMVHGDKEKNEDFSLNWRHEQKKTNKRSKKDVGGVPHLDSRLPPPCQRQFTHKEFSKGAKHGKKEENGHRNTVRKLPGTVGKSGYGFSGADGRM